MVMIGKVLNDDCDRRYKVVETHREVQLWWKLWRSKEAESEDLSSPSSSFLELSTTSWSTDGPVFSRPWTLGPHAFLASSCFTHSYYARLNCSKFLFTLPVNFLSWQLLVCRKCLSVCRKLLLVSRLFVLPNPYSLFSFWIPSSHLPLLVFSWSDHLAPPISQQPLQISEKLSHVDKKHEYG